MTVSTYRESAPPLSDTVNGQLFHFPYMFLYIIKLDKASRTRNAKFKVAGESYIPRYDVVPYFYPVVFVELVFENIL